MVRVPSRPLCVQRYPAPHAKQLERPESAWLIPPPSGVEPYPAVRCGRAGDETPGLFLAKLRERLPARWDEQLEWLREE